MTVYAVGTTSFPALAPTERARVIEANLPMARRLARRYVNRGEPLEDLNQVAAVALIKAVDAYDSGRGVPFASYAIPSIIGALKRHFRDAGWGMHVPRGIQELVLSVRNESSELTHRLGRPPASAELAARLDITLERLSAAQAAAQAYRPQPLDAAMAGPDGFGANGLTRAISVVDPRFDHVVDSLACRALVAALPERDRRIVTMRFYQEMTQVQIAAEIGVSQMQVSRLLRQSLTHLRRAMDASKPLST
jgi:RNA polymerase sigma-B factor